MVNHQEAAPAAVRLQVQATGNVTLPDGMTPDEAARLVREADEARKAAR